MASNQVINVLKNRKKITRHVLNYVREMTEIHIINYSFSRTTIKDDMLKIKMKYLKDDDEWVFAKVSLDLSEVIQDGPLTININLSQRVKYGNIGHYMNFKVNVVPEDLIRPETLFKIWTINKVDKRYLQQELDMVRLSMYEYMDECLISNLNEILEEI